MTYNLTKKQKEICRWLVGEYKKGKLPDEFFIDLFNKPGMIFVNRNQLKFSTEQPKITKGIIVALGKANMVISKPIISSDRAYLPRREMGIEVVLLGRLFEAVDSDFDSPDTSFTQQLSILADINNLDDEIKERCLPTLGADSSSPKQWDAAIRTAVVILEERLRDVGNLSDNELIGQPLVNFIFKNDGTMANRFTSDSKRQGYRDLYAGIVGIFRNPYTHRFIDPSPEDGGEVIGFINLLLKMLEDLR
jgi:hypothetical protein